MKLEIKDKLILLLLILSTSLLQAQDVLEDELFQFEDRSAVRIEQTDTGHILYDFGKSYFGSVWIKFNKKPVGTVIIHIGEKKSGNGVDRKPGGTIRYQKVRLKRVQVGGFIEVPLPEDGRNDRYPAVLAPESFGRVMPFRYVEIQGSKLSESDIEIIQKTVHYKFNDDASLFESSDTVLNQVWDLCKHTIKATSFLGYYVDGDRERIPYEADAYINQLSHYAVDAEYSIARRTNEYFMTQPTWPTEWILHTVLLYYYDFLYTGNADLLRNRYDDLKNKTLMALSDDRGLISTSSPQMNTALMEKIGFDPRYTGRPIEDIVDWPDGERDGYERKAVNTVVNSFFYMNMKLMADIAQRLGKEEESQMFSERAEHVKKLINDKLFDSGTGLFVDGIGSDHSSIHANMFPLAFDLVPEERKEKVVEFVKSKGMACSVYGAQYLLEALYKSGEAQYALELMTVTEGDRNWWNMIRSGSTMTMEAWDRKYKSNLDWNHAWGTAPANIIVRYMWGITPETPGFKVARIQPQMGDLEFSEVKVPTLHGPIYASFLRESKKQIFKIRLPTQMSGVFIAPENAKIKVNNGEMTEASEVKIEGEVVIELIF